MSPEASRCWASLNLTPVLPGITLSYWVGPVLNLTLTITPYDRGHTVILETKAVSPFLVLSCCHFPLEQVFLGWL